MAKKFKGKQCAFCPNPADGREHVVPKSWFPGGANAQRITVPACNSCNEGWEKEAEWFRALLVHSPNLADRADVARLRSVVEKSLLRRQSKGLASSLVDKRVSLNFVTPGGIYIGTGEGVRFDRACASWVLQRIVYGLHFKEGGVRLPPEAHTKVWLDQLGEFVPGRILVEYFGTPPPQPRRRVGSVLAYWMREAVGERLWVGSLFDRVWFAAHVRERAGSEAAIDPEAGLAGRTQG